MTTVTIPDELRRRIKRLAAKFDTNQAAIIEKSIDLLEKYDNGEYSGDSGTLQKRKKLAKFNDPQKNPDLLKGKMEFEQKYPHIAKVYRKIRANSALLEEITIGTWDLPFEEDEK